MKYGAAALETVDGVASVSSFMKMDLFNKHAEWNMYLQFWYSLSKMKSESGWYVTVSEDIFSVVEVEVAVELLSAVVWVVWRVIIVSCIIFLFLLIWNCDSYVIEKAFVLGDGATWSWFCDHCAFDVGDLVWFWITLWVLTSTVSPICLLTL